MQNQIPRARQSSAHLPEHVTAVQSVHAWIDIMKSTDRLLLAGLALEVGVEHSEEALRRWHAERQGPRDHLVRLARQLREIGG